MQKAKVEGTPHTGRSAAACPSHRSRYISEDMIATITSSARFRQNSMPEYAAARPARCSGVPSCSEQRCGAKVFSLKNWPEFLEWLERVGAISFVIPIAIGVTGRYVRKCRGLK